MRLLKSFFLSLVLFSSVVFGSIRFSDTGNGASIHSLILGGLYSDISLITAETFPPYTVDKSFYIDGVSDYFYIPDTDDLSFGNGTTDVPFSVSYWRRFVGYDSIHDVSKLNNDNSQAEWAFEGASQGKMYWRLYDENSSNYIQVRSSGRFDDDGTWYFFVLTYNGSGLNSGLEIYADASNESGTRGGLGSYTAMHNGTANVAFGATSDGVTTTDAEGYFTDIVFYNRVVTADEVTALYNSGTPNDPRSVVGAAAVITWSKLLNSDDLSSADGIAAQAGQTPKPMTAVNMNNSNKSDVIPP